MNVVANTKRFILRSLREARVPVQRPTLEDAINLMVAPKPLPSEVKQAFRELEGEDFIQGLPDALDRELVSYSLTKKGEHQAGVA